MGQWMRGYKGPKEASNHADGQSRLHESVKKEKMWQDECKDSYVTLFAARRIYSITHKHLSYIFLKEYYQSLFTYCLSFSTCCHLVWKRVVSLGPIISVFISYFLVFLASLDIYPATRPKRLQKERESDLFCVWLMPYLDSIGKTRYVDVQKIHEAKMIIERGRGRKLRVFLMWLVLYFEWTEEQRV